MKMQVPGIWDDSFGLADAILIKMGVFMQSELPLEKYTHPVENKTIPIVMIWLVS